MKIMRRNSRLPPGIRKKRLDERATVDAYNEAKQAAGWLTKIQENLAVPFETAVLGAQVIVEKIDPNDSDDIVAVCTRGRSRQPIPIVDLPLPAPPPKGGEWIEAHRWWCRGG